MNILAVDQGTSSTKALVVSTDGTVLAEAEVAVHPRPTADGGVEQDPEELWQSVVEAGRRALRETGAPLGAVGLANQGETVLAWDRSSGRPLSAAISWQDRRAARVCEALRERGKWLTRHTGLPLDPYFAAPKMRWLREHGARGGVCTTTDTWLLNRLCGAYVTDAATASRTLLLDLDAVTWSSEAAALFGIDTGILPAIVPCAGAVGETRAFGPVLPVTGVAVDQQAALFGEECLETGDAKCTYGTGAFLLANVGGRARRSRAGLAACVAWQIGGGTTYCLDGQAYTVGAALGWLQEIGMIDGPADLDRLGGADADTGGAVFVPGLAGLAAPFWRPAARGVFAGLSLATSRRQLVRAVIEGIAAQVAWLARAVAADLDRPLQRLRVDGGLTRSAALMQVQADLLQRPIEVCASPHATALGIAALARLGAGAGPSRGAWRPSAVYSPAVSADDAEARLQRWRAVAEATMDLA